MKQHGETAVVETVPEAPAEYAGLLRRLAAFAIDGLVLGLAGTVLGLLAGSWLSQLGAWGRALGFAIALAYFAPLDSRAGGGRSLGKRLLGLRLVRRDGQPPDLGRAALRFSLLGAPWFLNGLPLPPEALTTPLVTLMSLLIFGLGLALIYLWLFNRATRQSLHDFAAGTYVVRGEGAPVPVPPWPGHRWIIGLILAGALAAPALLEPLAHGRVFAPLLAIQRSMMQEPEVRYARVSGETTRRFAPGQDAAQSSRSFSAGVILRHHLGDDRALADRLAAIVLEQYPDAAQLDRIDISLAYGYDIGIASGWLRNDYGGSPQRWRQHLGGGAEPPPQPAP